MTDLESLLAVQEHDTELSRLTHRRRALPQRQELLDLERQLRDLEGSTTPLVATQKELDARQRELEDEVASVDGRVVDAERRLYSGTVTSPRELQALDADIASLKRHRSSLEDAELEIMIEREPVEAAVQAAHERRTGLDATGAALRVAIAEAEVAIDADAADRARARKEAAADVPAELLALYERTRTSCSHGLGVARLVSGSCTACRLKLSAVELDRIRREPPDALVRCEECSVVLVR